MGPSEGCAYSAQAAAHQVPMPGPEHAKPGGLIGNSTGEGDCVESPLGPAEKWSTKIKAEWFGGKVQLEVLTYDSAAKVYTWYWVDSTGSYTSLSKRSVSNDVLRVRWSAVANGKTYSLTARLKGLGSDKVASAVDCSEDGKTWKPLCVMSETRSKVIQ